MSALAVPRISIYLLAQCVFSISIGFYSTLLEPHLRQFNLSTQVTSLFFVLDALAYAIAAPILGRLIDKGLDPRKLIIFGCVSIICGFTILGPAPFLRFHATIIGSVLAVIMSSLGSACGVVAIFSDVLRSARDAGYPNTHETYVFITGLWTSSYALGYFLGPSVAGILYDLVGFQWATQFIVGLFIILLLGMTLFDTQIENTDVVGAERVPILQAGNRYAPI